MKKLILVLMLVLCLPFVSSSNFEVVKINNQYCDCDIQCSAESICITSMSDSSILLLDSRIRLWIRDAIDHHYSEGFCGKVLMKLPDKTLTDITSKSVGTSCREKQVKVIEQETKEIEIPTQAEAAENKTDEFIPTVIDSEKDSIFQNTFFLAALVYAIIVTLGIIGIVWYFRKREVRL